MFGYAAPAGAPEFGGLAWQEVQFNAVSGESATWHVLQGFGSGGFTGAPETAWHAPQLPGNVAEVTV